MLSTRCREVYQLDALRADWCQHILRVISGLFKQTDPDDILFLRHPRSQSTLTPALLSRHPTRTRQLPLNTNIRSDLALLNHLHARPELQRAETLQGILAAGAHLHDQHRLGLPAQRVLQEVGQLGVAVGHVSHGEWLLRLAGCWVVMC